MSGKQSSVSLSMESKGGGRDLRSRRWQGQERKGCCYKNQRLSQPRARCGVNRGQL